MNVIYQILIDRFANCKKQGWDKPQFLGGNIRGIIEKLDYIKELGADTIWISPFYKTTAYHGYHITDFFSVEPRFGTLQDLKELIEKVHENDMKIIADFVPNHCSDQHPFFQDAIKNKDSKYRKWFYFRNGKEYLCFLHFNNLPKLNLEHPPCRKHITDAAKHWLSQGLDGFRLDHVIGPTHNFWNHFTKELKKEFPKTVLIGEAWMKGIQFKDLKTLNVRYKYILWALGANPDMLFKQYEDQLDGVLDFRFQELMRWYVKEKISKQKLRKKLKNHFRKFDFLLPTFLDNHDMNRFLFETTKEKLKEAAEIQFSIDQPKIIYYGTETGLSHKRSIFEFEKHGDLQARKPMNWDSINEELLEFYKELIKSGR